MAAPRSTRTQVRLAAWIAAAFMLSSCIGAQQSTASAAGNPAQPPASSPASITVLEDTLIPVQTIEPINSKRARSGTPILFIVNQDVVANGSVAIPLGATVHGVVTHAKKPGRLTGSPELTIELVSLDLAGRNYPLYTYPFKATGTSKTRPTEVKAIRGAYVGAIAGTLIGGVSAKGGTVDPSRGNPVSMATGAAVGAGVGTAISAASPGPVLRIPSETEVDFYLASPLAVIPASKSEAARLAQGLRRGGPTLYLRSEAP